MDDRMARIKDQKSDAIKRTDKILTERAKKKRFKEVSGGKPKEKKVNVPFTIYIGYKKVFEKMYEDMPMPDWTKKQLSQAKSLVKKVGGEPKDALLVIDYVFRNWDFLKREWNIRGGYPTIEIILGYGHSVITDAVKTQAIAEKPVKKVGW